MKFNFRNLGPFNGACVLLSNTVYRARASLWQYEHVIINPLIPLSMIIGPIYNIGLLGFPFFRA